MNKEETINRILLEIRTKSILPTPDYTPTIDHYVPIRFVQFYLELAFTAGYDKGRFEIGHGKKVRQLLNGKEIKVWDSASAAARGMKYSRNTVANAIKHNYKTEHKYNWEYINEEKKKP